MYLVQSFPYPVWIGKELAFFEASVCICEEGIEPFPESVETAEEISLYFWMEEQSPS